MITSTISSKKSKILNIKKDIGETGVDVDSSAVIEFEGDFTSVIKSSFKKDLGSQSIIRGEKGSITINDTWFGDSIKKNIGNITYEIDKKSYSKVFSYEIENISNDASDNNTYQNDDDETKVDIDTDNENSNNNDNLPNTTIYPDIESIMPPKQSFKGHRNSRTVIKEATFFGLNDEFIVSGSDDGRVYFWLKATGRLIQALNADNERVLAEARIERDALLKEAREIKGKIINDAKEQANSEADKVLTSAKEQINNEKLKAITELKNTVANLSIDIAEKVLRSELSDKKKQEDLVENALKETELN